MSANFPQIAVIFLLVGFVPTAAQSQITPDSIANHIVMDSGHAREPYMDYATRLAKQLATYTPEQLHRILGEYSVHIPSGTKLNDELSLEDINFAKLSPTLTAAAKAELDKVATFLTDNPDTKITIEGHVSYEYSGAQSLSENRAMSAKLYLASQGIDIARVETAGFGFSDPIAEGKNNPENRRIEIYVKEPDEKE